MLPNVYGSTDKFTQSFGGNMVVTPEFAKLFCLDGDIRNLSILRGDVYVRDPKHCVQRRNLLCIKVCRCILQRI